MLKAPMTKKLGKVKTIVAFGLTAKQLIGVVIGICITIVIALVVPADLTIRLGAGIIVGAPFYLFGFINFHGLDVLEIMRIMIKNQKTPHRRIYQTKIEIAGAEAKDLKPNIYISKVRRPKSMLPFE